MRWNCKEPKTQPKIRDLRTGIAVAFLPKKIDNTWIWLEKYRYVQEYDNLYYGGWFTIKTFLIEDDLGESLFLTGTRILQENKK